MVKPQGYCGGVLKAINIAKQTRKENPNTKITILGNLVHNKYVKEALSYYQIDTIENKDKTRFELLDDIDSGIVIFTAHGISPQVRTKAKSKGLICIDASCPFVLQTQKIVKEYLELGYSIFYIGKNKHPEAESIYTMDSNVYLRQQAILDLKHVDALIVVGDPTSNNTLKLTNIGKKAGIQHIFSIQTVEEIDKKQFKTFETIAITSGASTPTILTTQVMNYLQEDIEKPKLRIQDIL